MSMFAASCSLAPTPTYSPHADRRARGCERPAGDRQRASIRGLAGSAGQGCRLPWRDGCRQQRRQGASGRWRRRPPCLAGPGERADLCRDIRAALARRLPAVAADINARAHAYKASLAALDADTRARIGKVKADRRRVVPVMTPSAISPQLRGRFIAPRGWSTESEPSAETVAVIVRQLRTQRAGALLLESRGDPRLLERIAAEAGVKVSTTGCTPMPCRRQVVRPITSCGCSPQRPDPVRGDGRRPTPRVEARTPRTIAMFSPSQHDVRTFFCESWRKQAQGRDLDSAGGDGGRLDRRTPRIPPDLSDLPAALAAVYEVEAGRTNPFLHLPCT